jgi:uroporphyrinogen decarboxylase
MTPRQRYVETILFGKPDLIPLQPGAGRKSTRERWHKEGLPAEITLPEAINEHAYRLSGGKLPWPKSGEDFQIVHRMIPEFEEKVIEKKGDTQVVQDWKGNVCEIGAEFGVEYLRHAIDFVTRRWIKCPVENRKDWEDMKRRYDPDDPSRLPKGAAALGKRLKGRDWPIGINVHGPFWQLREWMGFEQLCTAFYDEPELVADMLQFWQDFVARLLENALKHVDYDWVHFSEDMAYKQFSMISPKMVRQHLLPSYHRWGEILRRHKVPIYDIDSDGFIGELIPIWIEAGVNVCDPMEVAALNDINAFRRQFGHKMAYRGGVDKRAMAKGGDAIVQEFARIRPVVRDGGFIPGCDHGVPSDVSWPDYVRYVGLLARETGWL